jgi:hypothetical protein
MIAVRIGPNMRSAVVGASSYLLVTSTALLAPVGTTEADLAAGPEQPPDRGRELLRPAGHGRARELWPSSSCRIAWRRYRMIRWQPPPRAIGGRFETVLKAQMAPQLHRERSESPTTGCEFSRSSAFSKPECVPMQTMAHVRNAREVARRDCHQLSWCGRSNGRRMFSLCRAWRHSDLLCSSCEPYVPLLRSATREW